MLTNVQQVCLLFINRVISFVIVYFQDKSFYLQIIMKNFFLNFSYIDIFVRFYINYGQHTKSNCMVASSIVHFRKKKEIPVPVIYPYLVFSTEILFETV